MPVVEPPAGGQTRFGLLEAASVVTGGDPHTLLDVEFLPICGKSHLTVGACIDPETQSGSGGGGKEVDDGVTVVAGAPFAVYHLFECRPVGIDLEARARTAFEQSEGIAVEEWFGTYLSDHADAIDVTPASGAVTPQDGLAVLEAYAGANYGGLPVIHGDRGLASLLASTSQLSVVGGRLVTVLGSQFAAGGGYLYTLGNPSGAATPDGEAWLYATGPVGFWRGNILDASTGVELTAQAIVSASNPAGSRYGAQNVSSVLMERPYMAATSCLVVGCRVTTSACCPEGLPT